MTKENIYKILAEIEQSILKLKAIKKNSQDIFVEDAALQDRCKWNFYVLVQGCLDIGNHIIAQKRLGVPETYEDIIKILKTAHLIAAETEDILLKIAGFRNRLAHGYFKIDPALLYAYLDNLGMLEKFILNIKDVLGI